MQCNYSGSSQNNAGSALICCEALGRPACNYCSEEQRCHPTASPKNLNLLKCMHKEKQCGGLPLNISSLKSLRKIPNISNRFYFKNLKSV